VHQGALARESLPAAGSGYATDTQRTELRMLFRRYGCHHCGTRFGGVIADHQPPNKTVYGATRAAAAHPRASALSVADCRAQAAQRRRWRLLSRRRLRRTSRLWCGAQARGAARAAALRHALRLPV
jgi:hypothetical protein